jgi:hypothetical protein
MSYLRLLRFRRLIRRPFIRSTEKRGRNHFFERCSLHHPLRCIVFVVDALGCCIKKKHYVLCELHLHLFWTFVVILAIFFPL